jgi:glycosyltransferase involved in cell wall biosynthesis
MVKVAAFTGGRTVPSARFRVRQYIGRLSALGVEVTELPRRCEKYPPRWTLVRPMWLAASLAEEMVNCWRSRRYDVVLLQREIISKLITFERWMGDNVLLDVDDAIFSFRGGYVARELARKAAVIVCGNNYLADRFSEWNSRIRVIPTAVDTDRYLPRSREHDGLVIGWIGTSSNVHELVSIEKSIAKALAACPKAKLRVISNAFPALKGLRAEQLECVRWSETNEVRAIQGIDIGLMPLRDSKWARGKCAFKMIQYMACGLPSIVSPVGMNVEVLTMGEFSVAAGSDAEWTDAIVGLLRDPSKRSRMGMLAREVAERSFSVKVLAPRLASAIREAGGG